MPKQKLGKSSTRKKMAVASDLKTPTQPPVDLVKLAEELEAVTTWYEQLPDHEWSVAFTNQIDELYWQANQLRLSVWGDMDVG